MDVEEGARLLRLGESEATSRQFGKIQSTPRRPASPLSSLNIVTARTLDFMARAIFVPSLKKRIFPTKLFQNSLFRFIIVSLLLLLTL